MSIVLPALILALLLGASGCLFVGILILFGTGWALVSAAPCLLGMAVLFAREMKRNG